METTLLKVPAEVIVLTDRERKIKPAELELSFDSEKITVAAELPPNIIIPDLIENEECDLIIKLKCRKSHGELKLTPMDVRYIEENEGNTTVKIYLPEIISIETDRYDVIINRKNKQLIIGSESLQWYLNNLPQDMFLQVHRCCIIGKLHITGCNVKKGRGGNVIVGEQKIPVSRVNANSFLEWKKKEIIIP